MKTEPNDLLEQLRGELESVRGVYGRCGFGIVQSSLEISLDKAAWEYLAHVRATNDVGFVCMDTEEQWADPCPDGTWCIRWCGDERAIENLKRWADKVSALLRLFPGFLPKWPVSEEYYGTIRAFASVASTTPELSSLISRRNLLDGNAAQRFLVQHVPSFCRKASVGPGAKADALSRRVRETVDKLESTSGPGFSVVPVPQRPSSAKKGAAMFERLDIHGDALSFAAAVVDHLLERPRKHNLSVDLVHNQVILDGTRYHATRQQVLIIDVLLKADGELRSRSDMQNAYEELKFEEHLERHIAGLREKVPQVGSLIVTLKGKGSRLDLTWKPEERKM
jgi:hypothetical protein